MTTDSTTTENTTLAEGDGSSSLPAPIGVDEAKPEVRNGQHRATLLTSNSGDEASEDESDINREVIDDDQDLLDDYPNDVEDIELVHMRISAISNLKLDRFRRVQKLCFRQNQITDIEALDHLGDTLTDLDLYDNRISHIYGLDKLLNLQNLDLSFNNIKHIKRVKHLTDLRNLYFVQNKISKIENLEGLAKLKNLELGANRIREIENLHDLISLEELWLGKNKITELKNLSPLVNLRILSIQSNRLTAIKGLEGLANLEELYISHNAIEKIEGFENNTKLRVIDISNNKISQLTGLKHLSNLEEVWASNNELSSFEEIEHELADKKELTTVYFEGNPLQRQHMVLYRNKVRLALPQIKQIDATYVQT